MVVMSLTMTGIGKLVISLFGQNEMIEDMECMGKWMIWMSENNDRRIKETDGGDGSTKALSRGGSGVNWGHQIFIR